jgi:ParB-like chromosome segregation protein Spo0J
MNEPSINERFKESYLEIGIEKVGESYGRFRLIQPRRDGLMAKSIERLGQVSPVVVAGEENGRHEMIDGFKRLRALRQLKRESIRARVMDGHGRALKAAMIQLNREGRSIMDMEEALVVWSLYREEGLDQVEIGVLLDRHKSWVSRRIGLVEKLSEEVIEHLRLGLISPTQGRELIRLPRGNQKEAMESVLKHRLTSRETRRLVGMLMENPRWSHDATLWLPLQILEDRTPPRPPKKDPPVSAFDTALIRLEKCCGLVTQGIKDGLFSDRSPRIASVLKLLQETMSHLSDLASNGAF